MIIKVYRTASGRSPVEDYLLRLSKPDRADVLETFKAIKKYGLSAPISMRQIRGKLWELRISQTRIFYVIIESDTMVLLHAYKKQGQKAPDREIETALQRMAEFI